MATATFDTLRFANTLKAAGVPEKQAEAQAVAFAEVLQINLKELVTKEDLKLAKDEVKAEIKSSVDALRQELKSSVDSIRQELKASVEAIRQESRSSNDNVRHEIKESEQRSKNTTDLLKAELVLLKWMVGVVGFGILSLVIRVFAFRGGF